MNEWYYFTFGVGQPHAGKFVKIRGTFEESRQKMFDKYGDRWAFQYSEVEWRRYKSIHVDTETLLEVIE